MNSGVKMAGLVLVLLVLGCCGGTMMMLSPVTASVEKREQQAKTYGDLYTRQVLKQWNADALISLATDEYASNFKQAEFQATLDGNKRALGDFVSGKGNARLQEAARKGDAQLFRASYVNKATFKKGKASVRMSLVYENKRWSIDAFAVEPY